MSALFQVVHRTEYVYDDEVTESYGHAYLTPREGPGQVLRRTRIEVSPEPASVAEHRDVYGNLASYLEVTAPHARLEVTATSLVEVDRRPADLSRVAGLSWERARDGVRGAGPQALDAVDFLQRSPLIDIGPEVSEFGAGIFRPGRGVAEAVLELMGRIHREFRYTSGVTTVSTTLPEVLRRRAGVCQDFAHLAVGVLRSVGLPARYVSGYLETEPPPGRARLQGVDASHAWACVLLPELGWIDLDPTNDQLVDGRYVLTAWGRDYADVTPLKGVIFTESQTSAMRVAVDVARVEPASGPG